MKNLTKKEVEQDKLVRRSMDQIVQGFSPHVERLWKLQLGVKYSVKGDAQYPTQSTSTTDGETGAVLEKLNQVHV